MKPVIKKRLYFNKKGIIYKTGNREEKQLHKLVSILQQECCFTFFLLLVL